jgi:hypothetical protein
VTDKQHSFSGLAQSDEERIDEIRAEIHRLYMDDRNRRAAEIERLSDELGDIIYRRPEVSDAR